MTVYPFEGHQPPVRGVAVRILDNDQVELTVGECWVTMSQEEWAELTNQLQMLSMAMKLNAFGLVDWYFEILGEFRGNRD